MEELGGVNPSHPGIVLLPGGDWWPYLKSCEQQSSSPSHSSRAAVDKPLHESLCSLQK